MFTFLGEGHTTPWEHSLNILFHVKEAQCGMENCAIDFTSATKEISERAKELGGQTSLHVHMLPTMPIEKLASILAQTLDEDTISKIAGLHTEKMTLAYLEEKDVKKAVYHAELATILEDEPDMNSANNLGYLFFSVGNLTKAKHYFNIALTKKRLPRFFPKLANYQEDMSINFLPLVNYNLGILSIKENNYPMALECLNNCIELIEDSNIKDDEMGCLFVPRIDTEQIEFEEQIGPNLYQCAQHAKKVLIQFMQ